MLKDLGFLLTVVVGIATAIGCAVLIWRGQWYEAAGCGIGFAACILIAFWLAMTVLLDDSRL